VQLEVAVAAAAGAVGMAVTTEVVEVAVRGRRCATRAQKRRRASVSDRLHFREHPSPRPHPSLLMLIQRKKVCSV
jgi:hypothetical protein